MKQHITVDQVRELGMTEQEVVNALDVGMPVHDGCLNTINWHMIAKRLTIGKLIELIADWIVVIDPHAEKDHEWSVIVCPCARDKFKRKTCLNEELCDALWDAVKHIMKE